MFCITRSSGGSGYSVPEAEVVFFLTDVKIRSDVLARWVNERHPDRRLKYRYHGVPAAVRQSIVVTCRRPLRW